ncbi:Flp1 family type IVb pilin [Roseburia hominis]
MYRIKFRVGETLAEERGISTVELILVLVVIIGLVIIFKSQLTSLVESIFSKITSESAGI